MTVGFGRLRLLSGQFNKTKRARCVDQDQCLKGKIAEKYFYITFFICSFRQEFHSAK